ncbi:MAG: L-threonylcarbamoyladenylate synthase [Alcanivoracaceae bacterium]|jgi:tRNA threonylcarbamoyl adenosine modification protein (Sua5/YciO/YrdC/YwlC family)|nr:L-threonylcarbamoyladenylate synthase [Alcanivoracaceae bacterium]
MTQIFHIHPDNPQQRLIRQAADIVRKGGLIAYPTDTTYALGCAIGEKAALDRLIQLRRLDDKHQFSILCADLSGIATYAKVSNTDYRLIKAHTPGAYTFILQGTSEVPRRLMHEKKRTIGIRVPDNAICQALLAELDAPLMTSTLLLPGEDLPLSDPYDIENALSGRVDLIIDGGFGGLDETTVVSLVDEGGPVIVRQGAGPVDRIF